MEKKRYLLGFLVVVLVFSLAVTGCDETTSEWSAVTSLSQLNGRWLGSHSETTPFGDMDITMTMVVTIDATVNASAGTGSTKMTVAMTFSGSDLNDLMWAMIKSMLVESGATVNDTTKTISITEIEEGSIGVSDMEGVEIHQDGTKIRMLIPMGDELVTMVLSKQ
jgi:hypothetical protein